MLLPSPLSINRPKHSPINLTNFWGEKTFNQIPEIVIFCLKSIQKMCIHLHLSTMTATHELLKTNIYKFKRILKIDSKTYFLSHLWHFPHLLVNMKAKTSSPRSLSWKRGLNLCWRVKSQVLKYGPYTKYSVIFPTTPTASHKTKAQPSKCILQMCFLAVLYHFMLVL